ncbi:MAG: chromate transporter [Chloroflexota bacterium]
MDWLTFFWFVLKSYLFSTGGFGPLPSLHADLIARSWASEKQFTEALAVGQLSPGPNGLWVVSLSYLVAGVPGAVLATIALLMPPMLVLLVAHGHAQIADHPATQGLLDGVVLVIVGIGVMILAELLRTNGFDLSTLAIVVTSAALAIARRLPVNVILLVAAAAGLVLYWR